MHVKYIKVLNTSYDKIQFNNIFLSIYVVAIPYKVGRNGEHVPNVYQRIYITTISIIFWDRANYALQLVEHEVRNQPPIANEQHDTVPGALCRNNQLFTKLNTNNDTFFTST